MRVYATVLLLLAFILACGYSPGDDPELDAKVESICANVNEENWRTAMMDVRLSAHELCVHAIGMSSDDNELFPCTFGGYPMFCSSQNAEGDVDLYNAGWPTQYIMSIHAQDIERHHLDIVRL